jgi:hypothetical protein
LAALELIISADGQPGIQSLKRATGYVETDIRKIVQRFKGAQKRHGVLNLFAARQVATVTIHAHITKLKLCAQFRDVYYMHFYPGGQEQLIPKGGKEGE